MTRLENIADAAGKVVKAFDAVTFAELDGVPYEKWHALLITQCTLAEALRAPAGMDADEVNGILLRALSFAKQDAERCQAIARALVAETKDARAKEIFERASGIVGRAATWERLSGRPASALAVEVDRLGHRLAATIRESDELGKKCARLITECDCKDATLGEKNAEIADLRKRLAETEEARQAKEDERLAEKTAKLRAEVESARRGGEIESLRDYLQRASLFAAKDKQIAELEDAKQAAERELLEREGEVSRLEGLLAEKDAALEKTIESKNGALDDLADDLRRKDELLTAAQKGQAETQKALNHVQKVLNGRDERIAELERLLTEKDKATQEHCNAALDVVLAEYGNVLREVRSALRAFYEGAMVGDRNPFFHMPQAALSELNRAKVILDVERLRHELAKVEERLRERGAEVLDLDQMLRKERERGEALGTAAETDAWRNMPENLRIWVASLVTEFNSTIDACESLLTAQAPETAEKSPALFGAAK